MIRWMREHFTAKPADPDSVVPENPEHQHTLERADALLNDPRVERVLNERQRLMRESFTRAGRRLGNR